MRLDVLLFQAADLGARSLLHVRSQPSPELHEGHDHAAETAAEHAEHAEQLSTQPGTLDLRIAAIFVIWFGAVLMGMPTLVFQQFKSPDAPLPRLLRAFSGGVIVALALVHIIPEGVNELNSLVEFPVGGCAVLFGILALVLTDSFLAAYLAPEGYKEHIRSNLPAGGGAGSHQCGGSSSSSKHKAGKAEQQHGHDHGHGHSHDGDAHAHAEPAAPRAVSPAAHGHQCMRSLSATGWVASSDAPVSSVRQYVTAYTMELGCIFHSVIIGVGVGVITTDRALVVTLMIALAIHQGLEALALGSVLAATNFHPVKKVLMLLIYSITTPIGIAIGIALASSYDPESTTSKAVQGTLNGVSGGMLLYIGMYQLIAEEFSREDLLVRPKLRWGMYAALLLGAAAMCILGIWS